MTRSGWKTHILLELILCKPSLATWIIWPIFTLFVIPENLHYADLILQHEASDHFLFIGDPKDWDSKIKAKEKTKFENWGEKWDNICCLWGGQVEKLTACQSSYPSSSLWWRECCSLLRTWVSTSKTGSSSSLIVQTICTLPWPTSFRTQLWLSLSSSSLVRWAPHAYSQLKLNQWDCCQFADNLLAFLQWLWSKAAFYSAKFLHWISCTVHHCPRSVPAHAHY